MTATAAVVTPAAYDLASAVIELQPRVTIPLQRSTTGELTHALLLDLLSATHRPAAGDLHAPAQQKPLTVSPLHGGGTSLRELRQGEPYWFRVGALNRTVVELLSLLQARLPCVALLFGQPIEVLGLHFEGHPYALAAAAADLIGFHASRTPSRRVGFVFETPTRIETARHEGSLFPEPTPIFAHLARKWTAFTAPTAQGDQLGTQIEAYANRAPVPLDVSRYQLRTKPVYFRGARREFPKIAYTGRIEYIASATAQPEDLQALHLLADYAVFAGIGYGTPRGMGQVRPLHPSGGRLGKEQGR